MLSSIPAILISIIVLSIIVIIHEFGHFIVAKKSGVLVEEFAVGMGPMLFFKTDRRNIIFFKSITYRRILPHDGRRKYRRNIRKKL